MKEKVNKFYSTLFDIGEGIGFQNAPFDKSTNDFKYRKNRVVKWNGTIEDYNFDFQFYCINPIHPTLDNNPTDSEKHSRNKPRITQENVTSIRNFAIEFDECTVQEQGERLKLSKLPYSAIIYSGGKSLHTPIALEDPISKDEFEAKYECIKRILLKFDLKLDTQCKNINRLTRAPNEINTKTEKKQTLVVVNGRIKNSELDAWLEANGEDWTLIKKYQPVTVTYSGEGDGTEETRYKDALSRMSEYGIDSRQPWFYQLACRCLENGLSADYIKHKLSIEFSSYDEPGRRDAAVDNASKYAKITPRTINEPKVITDTTPEIDLSFLDDVEVKRERISVPYENNINHYAWIGSDIYLIYPDGKMEKYNIGGFKARFPSKEITVSMIPRKFAGFGYKPDYFNDGPIENNKYNQFKLPSCQIEKGEWPMTKILLKHIFGDQFELGLEYYWVKRHRPTQPLPALCLLGDEDAGKSTIGNHQQMCFANSKKINSSALERDENSYVKDCQDIIVEESSSRGVSRNSNPQAIVDKIKDMVTSTGGTIPCKILYENANEVNYYGKVMLFTNDITPLKMDGEATRFWVRKIAKPEKHVDFLRKLEDEVGHFLWYLDNEFKPSRYYSKERLWFNPAEYWTIEKETAKDASSSPRYRKIKDIFIEWFDDNEDEEFCYFDTKSLQYALKSHEETMSTYEIKDCLIKDFRLGEPQPRKVITDSLTMKIGQSPRQTRKMSYWKIDKNLKLVGEMEDLEKQMMEILG
jgi:hypothetical protein